MAHPRFDQDPQFRIEARKRALKAKAWELLVAMLRQRQAEGPFTQADLARAVGKKPETVSRDFARPQNMTLETVATYLSGLNAYLELRAVDALASDKRSNAVTTARGMGMIVPHSAKADILQSTGSSVRSSMATFVEGELVQ